MATRSGGAPRGAQAESTVESERARLERSTLAERATTALFEAILDGDLPAGSHLRLRELAERFGVSMMPLREAVRRLEHLGLVEVEPHRGAFVRARTLEDLRSTYRVRVLLEGEATALAAARLTPDRASAARAALDELALRVRTGETERARTAHERFHLEIYRAAGDPWLLRSIQPLWRNAERYRLPALRSGETARRRAHEHEAVLAAVLAGDAELARQHMVEHLTRSLELASAGFAAAVPA